MFEIAGGLETEGTGAVNDGLRGDGEREAFGAASPAVRGTGVAA